MDTETMINNMGGSIEENMYIGGPWAPEEILRKGLATTCSFRQVVAISECCLGAGPMGPA